MRSVFSLALVLALTSLAPCASPQEDSNARGEEVWLPALITETPQQGFELAVELARRGVTTTQSDMSVLLTGRQEYSHNPDSLIAASQVVAIHFRTIAEANNYWRSDGRASAE